MKDKDALLADAVAASASENPKSIIGDLMMHFDAATVIRIIKVFSGKNIRFPKIDSVWTHYRNRVIVDALSLKNTRQIREQLAGFFAISPQQVGSIFARAKAPKPSLLHGVVDDIGVRLYGVDKDDFVKTAAKSLR